MTVKLDSLAQLNRRAYAILKRVLGVVDALRFFGQIGLGTGNYTEERRELFADLTMDEYWAAVAKMQNGPS
jgi:hypothetical protein